MIIYSELTGETYETVNECLDAEVKYVKEKQKAEEEEKERQRLLDEAYTEAIKACEKYLELAGIKFEIDENEEDEDEEESFDEWFAQKLIDFFELQKGIKMTNEEKLFALKIRLHNLQNNNRNEDSPGVIKKLKRKIRNLEVKVNK